MLASSNAEWKGLVESKIRILVQNLERHRCIALAHVNPKCYTRTVEVTVNPTDNTPDTSDQTNEENVKQETKTEEETMWFIGLEFNKAEGINVDLTQDIKNFADTGLSSEPYFQILIKIFVISVTNTAKFGKFYKPEMTIDTKHVKRKELGKYLPQEVFKSTKIPKNNTNNNNKVI